MASNDYHNNLKDVLLFYRESHEQIIEKVCIELNRTDQIEYLKNLLLTDKLKLKSKRDPDKPKKPSTAYILFTNIYRDKIRQKFPDLKFGEINKKLGEEWKNITEMEKSTFKDQADGIKSKYEEELEEYHKNKKY